MNIQFSWSSLPDSDSHSDLADIPLYKAPSNGTVITFHNKKD